MSEPITTNPSIHELVNNYLIRRPPVDYYKDLLNQHLNSLRMSDAIPAGAIRLSIPTDTPMDAQAVSDELKRTLEPELFSKIIGITVTQEGERPQITVPQSIVHTRHELPYIIKGHTMYVHDIKEDLRRNLKPETFNKIRFVGLAEQETPPPEASYPHGVTQMDTTETSSSAPTQKEHRGYGWNKVSHQLMYSKDRAGHMVFISRPTKELPTSIDLRNSPLGYYINDPSNTYFHVFRFQHKVYTCGPKWGITNYPFCSMSSEDGRPFVRVYFKVTEERPNSQFGPSLQPWRVFFDNDAAEHWIRNYHAALDLKLEQGESYANRNSDLLPQLIDVIEVQHKEIQFQAKQIKQLQDQVSKHYGALLNRDLIRHTGIIHWIEPDVILNILQSGPGTIDTKHTAASPSTEDVD